MKSLLTTLSVLRFVTTAGNLNNILEKTYQKNNISANSIKEKTQKIITFYKDKSFFYKKIIS